MSWAAKLYMNMKQMGVKPDIYDLPAGVATEFIQITNHFGA